MKVIQCKPCFDKHKRKEWSEYDKFTVLNHLIDIHKLFISDDLIKNYIREVSI